MSSSLDDDRLRAFLGDSLDLWHMTGTVEVGAARVAAVIRAETGAIVWIERPLEDDFFRWAVRWRGAGEAPGSPREVRPRMCGSLVGVLSALRTALDVDRGTAVRIAPAREGT